MDGLALSGLGRGAMAGLERYRRHRREDEQDQMRRDEAERRTETHGLNMRRGEQVFDQADQLFPGRLQQQQLQVEGQQLGNRAAEQSIQQSADLFPERLQGLRLGNQANQQSIAQSAALFPERLAGARLNNQSAALNLENARFRQPYERRALQRQDAAGEQEEWARNVAHGSRVAMRALTVGDFDALTGWANEVDPESGLMFGPGESGGSVTVRSPYGERQMSLNEVQKFIAEMGNPEVVMQRAMTPSAYGDVEYQEGVGYGQRGPDNKWNPINVKNSGGGGAGVLGGGGLDNATQSLIERTARQYWGSMNAEGAFIVPEDARDNYLLTQQRAVELAAAGLPPQAAVNYAALSLSGPLSKEEAQKMALQELRKSAGLLGPSGAAVSERAAELMEESREADEVYRGLTGGGFDARLRGRAGRVDTSFQQHQGLAMPRQATPDVPAAPDGAIAYLRENNTPAMQQAFREKYGYLPEGF